jgi:hypothetical protein
VVTGEWRKLHNENVGMIKSRRTRWERHVTCMGRRGVYRVLVGKTEGKRSLGRPRVRWENNINMDLQEVGRGSMDWIELAQDTDRWRILVNVVMNLRVPKKKCGEVVPAFDGTQVHYCIHNCPLVIYTHHVN